MEVTRPEPTSAVASGIALAMALGAAILLVVAHGASTDVESLETLSFVLGWALLIWAVIVGAAVLVHLLRTRTQRRPGPVEVGLLVATVLVVLGVLLIYPPIGSGAGIG
jgi:formate-dependent nitrite reductase membrane component NrfD